MQHDAGRGEGGKVAVAGDVVGVRVGFDDAGDAQALLARDAHVLTDAIPAGVDHDRLAGLATPDQVGQAARFLVQELLKNHNASAAVPSARPSLSHIETGTMRAPMDVLAMHAAKQPDAIALVEGDRALSWREMVARRNRLAHGLLG